MTGMAIMAGFTIANATPVDVTIWDGQGVAYEDNETEPGTMTGNAWDFEMATLDGNTLSLIGTWDFVNGTTHNNVHYTSGDLFFNIGAPNDGSKTGWDYVIDVNWSPNGSTYTIHKGINSIVGSPVSFRTESDPFTYVSGATSTLASGNVLVDTVAEGYMGVSSWIVAATHNRVSFDISTIINDSDRAGQVVFGHWTQSCGNDDGDWTVPDGGLTLIMLGAGLSALAMMRRRLA